MKNSQKTGSIEYLFESSDHPDSPHITSIHAGCWGLAGPTNYMAIEDTMIRYSDDPMNREDSPADCVLNMPPSRLDWLEARLPGGIPGVYHCGVVSDEISAKARSSWRIREEAENQKHEQAVREYNERSHAAPPTPAEYK